MAEERHSNPFLFLILIAGLIWYFFRDSFQTAGSVTAPVIQNNGAATISAGAAPMVSAVSPNVPTPVPGANPLNPNVPLTPARPVSAPGSTLRIATETFGVAAGPVLGRQTSTPENGGTFFPPPAAPPPPPPPTIYRNPFTGYQFTAATARASNNGFKQVVF